MTLSIGRVVHFLRGTQLKPSPAIVTYVHSETLCNLHVFKDASPSEVVTSVTFVQTEDEARDALDVGGQRVIAFWPARV